MDMTLRLRFPFALTASMMLGILVWLALEWARPVIMLFDGRAFGPIDFVWDGGAGGTLGEGVTKMYVVSVYLTAILIPLVAVLRVTASLSTKARRVGFLVLALAQGVFPASAVLLAFIASTRYACAMGLTLDRFLGMASGVIGILVIGGSLYLVARSLRQGGSGHSRPSAAVAMKV